MENEFSLSCFLKNLAKYKKFFEITLFAGIQIILAFGVLGFLVFLHTIVPLFSDLLPEPTEFLDASAFAVAFLIAVASYLLFKILIFPLLYIFKAPFGYIHSFLNKFLIDKNFRMKILLYALLADIIGFFAMLYIDDFDFSSTVVLFLILGGGVLTSYISFYIIFWFKSDFWQKNLHINEMKEE